MLNLNLHETRWSPRTCKILMSRLRLQVHVCFKVQLLKVKACLFVFLQQYETFNCKVQNQNQRCFHTKYPNLNTKKLILIYDSHRIPAIRGFPGDPITAPVRPWLNSHPPAVYLLTCVKRFAATGQLTDLITKVHHRNPTPYLI